jgi:DNA-binding MarR family transcriptional regulator
VPDKNIAKALERKIGFDVSILKKTEYQIGEQSLLMNSSRRKIFQYICNHPCSHLREVSRATENSPQTVKWHIGKLKETDLITERTCGKKKIFTPLRNIISNEECKIISLLRGEDAKKVYLAILHNPKITQKELCEILDIYQQRLSLVLHKLILSNLIYEDKIGRVKAYTATKKVRDLEEGFTQKSEDFINALMDALYADSLNPKIESSTKDTILIRVTIASGEPTIMRINSNPVKDILEGG